MRRNKILAPILAGVVGMFAGLTMHLAISAEDNAGKEAAVDEVEALRQRLATLSEIENKEKFLVEYWDLLAQHRVRIAVKRGDRYVIGGAFLVEGRGAEYTLVSSDGTKQVVEKVAHVVTKRGIWKELSQENLPHAYFLLISTDHYVFAVDLKREMISVIAM